MPRKNQLQTFIDISADGILLIDTRGMIIDVNKSMSKISGHPRKYYIGKHISSLRNPIAKESIPVIVKNFMMRIKGKNISPYIIKTRHKNGSLRWAEISSQKIDDGSGKTLIMAIVRDVTERVNMENGLKNSEENYRNVVENANETILIAQDGLIKYVNKKAKDVLNYSSKEMLDKPFDIFIHSDDRKMVIENYKKRISGGNPPEIYSFRALTKERVIKWLEINAVLINWEGKRATLNFLNDITEQKKAEEKLFESEEKFRLLFENSRDALMTLEPPSWAFTSGNQATVEMFRAKSAKEFISFTPGDLSPKRQPDGRASAKKSKEMIKTAMRKGSHFFEWTHKRINGQEFPATILLTRVEVNGKIFLQATVRDISERKKAEAEIESLARFPSENPYPVLRTDTLGNLLYKNDPAKKIIEGCECFKANKIPDHWLKAFSEAVRSGSNKIVEDTCANKIIQYIITPIKGNDYVNIYGFDVSELRNAEKELINAEKFRMLGILATGIAHEVRNPLVSIKGFFQLLDELKEGDPERKELAKIAVGEIDRIEGLLTYLFGYARPMPGIRQNIYLSEILNPAITLTRYDAEKRGVFISLSIENDCMVFVDPKLIQQVILNLIINALESIKGSGTIKIKVYSKVGTDHAFVEFVDDGCGMSKEAILHAFTPFFTTKQKGSGLGLSLSQNVIIENLGKIDIKSDEGEGTRVTFSLPLAPK